jgi:hypothetical protein
MRIVHIIPFLWSGAGKVLTDLCVSQRAQHDVMIVTSGSSKGLSDWPVYRAGSRRTEFCIDAWIFSIATRRCSGKVSSNSPISFQITIPMLFIATPASLPALRPSSATLGLEIFG